MIYLFCSSLLVSQLMSCFKRWHSKLICRIFQVTHISVHVLLTHTNAEGTQRISAFVMIEKTLRFLYSIIIRCQSRAPAAQHTYTQYMRSVNKSINKTIILVLNIMMYMDKRSFNMHYYSCCCCCFYYCHYLFCYFHYFLVIITIIMG